MKEFEANNENDYLPLRDVVFKAGGAPDGNSSGG